MSATLLRSLAEIVGPAHCLGGADRAPYVVDGRTPCGVVLPGSADEVGARGARGRGGRRAGAPVGRRDPDGLAARRRGTAPSSSGLRRLARVVEHEPGDLTATVEAGITLDALQAALGARGQWLPLDPPAPGVATLGGVLAANTAGPRRHGLRHRPRPRHRPPDRGGGRPADPRRRQGREERGRLRPREALHRLARHARHHRRRDAEAPSPARGRGRLLGDVPHPRGGGGRPRR